MLRVRRALLDPSIEESFLFFGKLPLRIGRRHLVVGIVATDAPVQFAILQAARLDAEVAAEIGEELFLGIEPKFGLLVLRVRPMATKALVRENGPNVAVEIDRGVVFRVAEKDDAKTEHARQEKR